MTLLTTRLRTRPTRQTAVCMAAAVLMSSVAAYGTGRIFSDDAPTWAVLGPVAAVGLAMGVASMTRWYVRLVVALLGVVAGGCVAVVAADGALPGDLLGALRHGVGDIVSAVWPAPPTPAAVALVAMVSVAVVAASVELVIRRHPVSAIVPPIALVGFTALLSADGGAPPVWSIAALVATGLVAMQTARTTRHSGLSIALSAGVVAIAVIVPVGLQPVLSAERYDPRDARDEVAQPQPGISPLSRVDEWRSLDENTVMFATSAPDPAPWRLVGLDRYDGDAWLPADDYRRSSRRIAEPVDGTPVVDVDVQIGAIDSAWLPMLDTTVGVSADVSVDGGTSGLLPLDPPTLGTEYSLDVQLGGIQPAQATNARFAPGGGQFVGDFEVSPEVVALASRIVAGGNTDFERAAGIATYLREQYALDPETPPGHGIGVLDSFIVQTRRGRDEQFVAAYALLAAAAEIPVRIVVGFDTVPSPTGDGTVAYSQQATAWPEVDFEGVGWVRFDPVPAPVDGDVGAEGEGAVAPIDDAVVEPPATTIAPTSQTSVPADAGDTEPPAGLGSSLSGTTKASLAGIGGAVLVLGGYVAVVLGWKARRRARRSNVADPDRRTVGAFTSGVDMMIDLGLAATPSATDRQLVSVGGAVAGDTVALLEPAAELSTAAVYSPVPNSSVDADDAWAAVVSFEHEVAASVGRLRYLRARLSTRSLRHGLPD